MPASILDLGLSHEKFLLFQLDKCDFGEINVESLIKAPEIVRMYFVEFTTLYNLRINNVS